MKNDGGPAFPETHVQPIEGDQGMFTSLGWQGRSGMSLRDYFAAHALTNLRMNNPAYDWQLLAEQAYRYADAMLDERDK